MLTLEYATQFKKDFKKIAKLPIPDVVEVGHVIKLLQLGETLPDKYVDHMLSGNWQGYRDCHVKPDLLLIYKADNNSLKLARIGTHSELFR
ncbi:addiction module toxin RelE [Oleiphilus sp. HI0081]|jgi:mRNA interferase YafQ|uniref:type II toxin-antitoxin system RelE/ParE family toxin n=1 Tax=unclassified Oleiphilus TaxID=2631174 RepID=UPI0007C3A5FE|nr:MULTISPECIES: type II toxin-antitoxin system YafQ family toxin [unclassified Oleiphilus]KZY74296.1 addiction module toxin RelE [Oleiphilus sp. HI0068]KZY80937.1 addiction module toxin RelE [Oleiphilus sp. HI0069]KZY85367.1 addiction module toxin RelE [Oleiphilus sp. HI0072]KZZ18300.1 addiction module toxin RelE [Oleiphilus sp. HI0078]KZZ28972.1 addiction module toxin RelE [Oleiphilus sp. HI0081]|tara:strand:- start:869 stop:1141 length:273 start_codon:yes stop_codon:yes gene_type:complete